MTQQDGYVEPVTIVTMNFGGKRAGLTVLTREPSAETWEQEIVPLLDFADKPMKFVDVFVKQLDSWNLKREDGTAVPATREGLMSMNIRFVNEVLKAWINNGILVLDGDDTQAPQADQPEDEPDPFEGKDIPTVDMDTFAPVTEEVKE